MVLVLQTKTAVGTPPAKTPPHVDHSKVRRCCVLGICIFISDSACVSVITTGNGLRLGVGVGKSARGVGGGQLMTTASAYDSQKFQLFQQQALGCQKAYVKLLSIQPRLPDWEMAGKCPACLNWSSYTYLKVAGQTGKLLG